MWQKETYGELAAALLIWTIVAELAFSAIAAATWILRLDALGKYHSFGWFMGFSAIIVIYAIPFAGGYVFGLVALALSPRLRESVARRVSDKRFFISAAIVGGLLGAALFGLVDMGNSIDL